MPRIKYGLRFEDGIPDLHIELLCFRRGHPPEKGGLGKYGHFKNIVEMLWPYDPKKHKQGVQWHPWFELMMEEACRWQYLGISGPKSSAKTESFAIWALVNWFCAPEETLLLVTSTTMKEARKRIWGAIRERYQQSPFRPGKLVDSMGIIRLTDDDVQDGETSDRASISLIPSSPEKEKEATAKLIGLKQKRVILIGDEMTDIAQSVVEACHNLDSNPYFQFIALGNFKSMYDPFGQFVTPRAGWNSVSVDDERWETERGLCLHLDGTKTPNAYSDPVDKWPFLYRQKQLEEAIERGEENTIQFWRFVRSFPAPTGADDAIYSEADFRKFKVDEKPIWKFEPTPVCGFDPGFTNDGDRSVAYFGYCGETDNGKMTVAFHEYVELKEDVRQTDVSRSYQIARQLVKHCVARNISPKHVAVDATGAGDPLCDVIEAEWGAKICRVKFSSSPTDLPVSRDNPKPAKDLYKNRVTELWYVGVEFLRSDQLRGIGPALAREMTSRKYETAEAGKIRAEPKRDMKLRTGRSPDIADAAFLMLDVCRQRLGFQSVGLGNRSARPKDWNRFVQRVNNVYAPQELSIHGG